MHNSITIRLPDAMIQGIDEICKEQHSTRQDVIRNALSLMLFNGNRIVETNATNHSENIPKSNSSNPKAPSISDSKIEQPQRHIPQDKVHSKIHAIVIEDDTDMKDVFVEILKMHNITVIGTGSNGKEAAEIYERLHPDVVFMDVIMPTYDGIHGINEIKKIDPNAKIILVTGAAIDAKKNPLYNTTQIVTKPIDMQNIMNAVDKIMIAS
jgi:two-component system, chemotaxis family, chemotaxis protein CheY